MSVGPRPRAWSTATKTLLGLLALALILFIVVAGWFERPLTLNGTIIDKTLTNPTTAKLELRQQVERRDVLATVFRGVSLTFIGVCLFELLRHFIQVWIYRFGYRRAFDRFFGDDASERSGNGIALLRSETLSNLLGSVATGFEDQLAKLPDHRLFAARTWINRYDADAVRTLNNEFRRLDYDVALFRPVSDSKGANLDDTVPFVISTGLTFATEMLPPVAEALEGWAEVRSEEGRGRVLELKASVVPETDLARLDKKAGEKERYIRIVPKNWNLGPWIKGEPTDDYAVLMRHTSRPGVDKSRRQVFFVLAGFTERGTAAAARYLAANWHSLYEKYVDPAFEPALGDGDFFAVIAGPSEVEESAASQWAEDPNWRAITPQVLWDRKIKSIWANRIGPILDSR